MISYLITPLPSPHAPIGLDLQDGPEAVRRIRERGYRGLIIGITGDTEAQDKEFFQSQGADVVLSKPIKEQDIKAVVEAFQPRR